MDDNNTFALGSNQQNPNATQNANPLNTGNGNSESIPAQHLQTDDAQRINIQSIENQATAQQTAQAAQSVNSPENLIIEDSAMTTPVMPETPAPTTPAPQAMPETPVPATPETAPLPTATPETQATPEPIATPQMPSQPPIPPAYEQESVSTNNTPTPEPVNEVPAVVYSDPIPAQATPEITPTPETPLMPEAPKSNKKMYLIYGGLVLVLITAVSIIIYAYSSPSSDAPAEKDPNLTNTLSTENTENPAPPGIESPFADVADPTSDVVIDENIDVATDGIVNENLDPTTTENLNDLQEIVDDLSTSNPPNLELVPEEKPVTKVTR